MSELCTDNRFELIEKYKAKLIEATNIETDTLDMAAIDSILFRFWQMGWLDKLDAVDGLTDKEQRIFLAAMWREEEVCKQVDAEFRDWREPYEDTLVSVCHEIRRKVKDALWTI